MTRCEAKRKLALAARRTRRRAAGVQGRGRRLFAQARKTLTRHRDHLWMLGGDIIRRCQEDRKLRRQPIAHVVLQLIDDEGGPLLWPSLTAEEQVAFDAICRKLYKFLAARSER